MIIYLVNGHINYEGHTTISAFTDESQANAFVIQCEEYNKLKHKSSKRLWEDNHPARYTGFDFYEVDEVELK